MRTKPAYSHSTISTLQKPTPAAVQRKRMRRSKEEGDGEVGKGLREREKADRRMRKKMRKTKR